MVEWSKLAVFRCSAGLLLSVGPGPFLFGKSERELQREEKMLTFNSLSALNLGLL